MAANQKIATCLWFDREAEEAATFYVSVLPDARILSVNRYGKGMPLPEGTALTVEFEIAGQRFIGLNGGPMFKLSEAVSISVSCETQAEVDDYWTKLSAGGAESRCGWLKDKYGLSWQIVPTAMQRMMKSGDPVRAGRMMGALMQMGKLDIAKLEAAWNGA